MSELTPNAATTLLGAGLARLVGARRAEEFLQRFRPELEAQVQANLFPVLSSKAEYEREVRWGQILRPARAHAPGFIPEVLAQFTSAGRYPVRVIKGPAGFKVSGAGLELPWMGEQDLLRAIEAIPQLRSMERDARDLRSRVLFYEPIDLFAAAAMPELEWGGRLADIAIREGPRTARLLKNLPPPDSVFCNGEELRNGLRRPTSEHVKHPSQFIERLRDDVAYGTASRLEDEHTMLLRSTPRSMCTLKWKAPVLAPLLGAPSAAEGRERLKDRAAYVLARGDLPPLYKGLVQTGLDLDATDLEDRVRRAEEIMAKGRSERMEALAATAASEDAGIRRVLEAHGFRPEAVLKAWRALRALQNRTIKARESLRRDERTMRRADSDRKLDANARALEGLAQAYRRLTDAHPTPPK